MKLENFAEIYETSTSTIEVPLPISKLKTYIDDAAYVAENGTATLGDYYYNTTDNLIHYYTASWIKLNDHDFLTNIGMPHIDLDWHVHEEFKHFEMLDEDDLSSNSSTKCPTQQSLKAYTDAAVPTLTNYVYNETIAQGDLLKIINDSGAKVEKIVGVDTLTQGSEVVFKTADLAYISSCYDTLNNKVVVTYRDYTNNSYGTAVVGSISGTSITFGTPVVFNSGIISYNSCIFDSNSNKVVIAYQDSSALSYGKGIVGTISGTSISFGTEVTFNSGNTMLIGSSFDSNSNKVVIAYADWGNSYYGTAVVGTVSGTSISFGTPVVFNTASISQTKCCFDHINNKTVIVFRDITNSGNGTVIVGEVSGTSISFGPKYVFNSGSTSNTSCAFDSTSSKVVISYSNGGASDRGTVSLGRVLGNDISFSSKLNFNLVATTYTSCVIDSINNRVLVFFRDDTDNFGKVVVGKISNDTISFSSETTFNSGTTTYVSATQADTTSAVFYSDGDNSWSGTARALDLDVPEHFMGIAQEAGNAATGHPVAVLYETSEVHSGATPGDIGYIQSDGSLGTSVSDYPIGIFISPTEFEIYKD